MKYIIAVALVALSACAPAPADVDYDKPNFRTNGEVQDSMLIRLTHTGTRASVSVMGNPALFGGRHGSFLL